MFKNYSLILSIIIAFLSIPVSAMNETCPASILIETDRAFSKRAQEIGVPEAFLEFAAEDAVVYRNGIEPLIGKEAIGKVMKADPEATLIWEPISADMAESGDLGYTRGHFVYTIKPGPDGNGGMGPFEGYYVSIWKIQSDGTWKWVFDSGIISKNPPTPLQDSPSE
jgi:ketosteroid isomerase-like protein